MATAWCQNPLNAILFDVRASPTNQGTMDNFTDSEPALDRVQARRDAFALLLTGPVVTALLIVVWAAAGAGYFWPIWPLLGISLALVAVLWRAFGPTAQAAAGGVDPRAARPR
jgi:hypothetical protein